MADSTASFSALSNVFMFVRLSVLLTQYFSLCKHTREHTLRTYTQLTQQDGGDDAFSEHMCVGSRLAFSTQRDDIIPRALMIG